MNLSPVEAINRVNESVTVEMLVQRTKCCTGSRQPVTGGCKYCLVPSQFIEC